MPFIYEFEDPVAYLKQCFSSLKAANPELTLRKWAHQMGFESADVLAEVMNRKRSLRLKWVEYFARGINLDASERLYFQVMIQGSNAKTEEERELFEKLLREISPGKDTQILRGNEDDLFSNWLNMAILSFCKIGVNGPTRDEVVDAFAERASCNEVVAAIDRLVSFGVLKESSGGFLQRTGTTYTGKTDDPNAGARQYYRQVTELAQAASEMDVDQREFQCFSIAMDHQKLPLAKEMIRTFRNRLSSLCDEKANQVFQVNLQCFPLTAKPSSSSPKRRKPESPALSC